MGSTIKEYLHFAFLCAKRSVSLSWGTANNAGGAVISLICGMIFARFWPSTTINPIVATVLYTLIAWGVLLFLWGLFIAPFNIYREQRAQIRELGTVDARDLERMLGGKFLGNTFLVGNDGYLCAHFTGRSDLLHLDKRSTRVSVRAPKHSVAGIYFQFMNGHPALGKKCRFYYLDASGNEVLMEDIYSEQSIKLDADGSFEFKLSIDEGYDLNDQASLQVLLRHWTK